MNRPISKRRFFGTIVQLQKFVAMASLDGDWEQIPYGWCYRSHSGALLNWWPATGTINFQGPHAVATEFEGALLAVIGNGASRPFLTPDDSR